MSMRHASLCLLIHQKKHADNIERSLLQHRVALDASDPGTGKTYVACAVSARLQCPVVIITTKATAPNWEAVAAGFGVSPLLVTNYEKIRLGKFEQCRLLARHFVWHVPENTLLIFDECQKCKGRTSLNSRLLIAARRQHLRLLLCSATAASNPLEMRALGFALGLHQLTDFWPWAVRHGVEQTAFGMAFSGDEACLRNLHLQIFPTRGSRMRIADIADFPATSIEAAVIETGHAKAIQRIYDKMRHELSAALRHHNTAALDDLAKRLDAKAASQMTILLRARQAVELYKVPALVEMTRDAVEEGMSVVLLVNFDETIERLSLALNARDSVIRGGQSPADRQRVIERFQRNEVPVVVANIQAGGVGVSLHDPTGNRPRLSLISPSFSAQDLRQALGRVHRAGSAASIQKICFAAGTCEQHTAQLCAAKLAHIDLLNDGDLAAPVFSTPIT